MVGWHQGAGMSHYQTMRLSFCKVFTFHKHFQLIQIAKLRVFFKVNLGLELERRTSTEGWGLVSTMGLPLPRKSLQRMKNQLKKRRRGRLSALKSSVLESGSQPML